MRTNRNRLPVLALVAFAAALLGPAHAEVPTDPFDASPLLPGAKAPTFAATTATGETFRFDPDAVERPALVVFYRGGWCPYCMLHWAEMRDIEPELVELGYDLLFLSADRAELLAEAIAEQPATDYMLLSDASMEIAESFGVAFQVDAATVTRYKGFGIDLEEASGYDHHRLPVPSVFLIGTDGIIKFQYANPDYKVRLHPDVLLAAARTMPERKLKR